MFMNFSKMSIRSKFLLSSVLTLFLISLFIFTYYPTQQKEQIFKSMEIKDHAVAKVISLGVGVGMSSSDFTVISEAISWAKNDSNLAYIIILDENEEIFASYNPDNIFLDLPFLFEKDNLNTYIKDNIHTVKIPVIHDNINYGTLLYGSSLEYINKNISENLQTTTKVCLLILILGVISSYLLSSMITRPLTQLTDAARKVSHGNHDVKISTTGSDEINILGNAFNDMIGNIQETMNSLRNSEKNYQMLSDASPVGIIRTDLSGKGIYVNEQWCEITGISEKEIIGKDWIMSIYPDDRKNVFRKWKKAFKQKIPFEYEFRFLLQDGTERWVYAQSVIDKDDDGNVFGHIGTINDISVRKRTEFINHSLIKILESTNTTSNLEEFLSTVDQILGSLINTTNFYVALYDSNSNRYSFPFYKDAFEEDAIPVNLDNSLTDYVRRTEKPLFCDDEKGEELIQSDDVKMIGKPSPIWLGVPLKTPQGVIGVAVVQSYDDPYCYSKDDLDIMVMASGHIAMAIARKRAEDEIKDSEELLRATLESTADGILVVDKNGKVTNANRRFTEMWKIPLSILGSGDDDQLLAFVLQQLIDPKAFVEKVEQLYNCSDESMDTLYFKDGRVFDRYSCPLMHEKEIAGRVWSFRDITESKKTEKKLSELAVFPEANSNMVISLDENLNVLYMNSATLDILFDLGLDKSQINECLPDNLKDIISETALDEISSENYEVTINNRTLLWSFIPVKGQKIVHGYAIDITEQILQEKEMRKLSTVVNQSSNIVCITDKNQEIEYVNPYFTEITGYKLNDMIGKPISMLYVEADSKFIKEIWEAVKSGKAWTGNIQNMKKDSSHYWERQTITPIFSKNGELTNYLISGSDITKELLVQQKLIESDKLSAIGTLAAGVAHEFKNYLGGIIGNASFSLDELESDDGIEIARDTLKRIIDMGEKANDVAMSLLTFSKTRPEDFQIEDIEKLIIKTIKLVEIDLKKTSIEVITHFENVQPIEISSGKIQQLLLNLLINAKQAVKQNGVISVMTKTIKDKVEIRISDSGSGISKDNLEKIFDPFFSTKGVWGKDDIAGTGMGLSICRNIAREHGGDITVESVEGLGTTFYLTLPVYNNNEKSIVNESFENKKSFLIFSLDKSIYTHYYDSACVSNVKLQLADQFMKIEKEAPSLIDFVICDVRFAGKLELLKLIEWCNQNQIPYVMVHCGIKDYQLDDLYRFSKANFKELPAFNKIIEAFPLSDIKQSC